MIFFFLNKKIKTKYSGAINIGIKRKYEEYFVL